MTSVNGKLIDTLRLIGALYETKKQQLHENIVLELHIPPLSICEYFYQLKHRQIAKK